MHDNPKHSTNRTHFFGADFEIKKKDRNGYQLRPLQSLLIWKKTLWLDLIVIRVWTYSLSFLRNSSLDQKTYGLSLPIWYTFSHCKWYTNMTGIGHPLYPLFLKLVSENFVYSCHLAIYFPYKHIVYNHHGSISSLSTANCSQWSLPPKGLH